MPFAKSIKITFSILLILLLTSPVNEGLSALSGKRHSGSGKNHALIIGISNYDEWPKLESPVKDAEEIAKILTEKYNFKKSNITILTDTTKEKPEKDIILDFLDNYLKKLTEQDNFLVFFSGHSEEDDEGETYWIPKDGRKNKQRTWLSHTELGREYFASEKLKAKNLCIITDSPFSTNLIKIRSISLTPFDLRYSEKIIERAARRSREVIAFGDKHWPGSKNTNGLGLFAYYISKALTENELEIIDFENLIFDENIIFSISKIAGTKMQRGRLETPIDARGQFIISRIIAAAVIDVVDVQVSPPKGYPGDTFLCQAKTSAPATEVYIEIQGEKFLMKGTDTEWKYNATVDSVGKIPFKVMATNRNDVEGQPRPGQIFTIKKLAKLANVIGAAVNPKTGSQGDEFRFTATTDAPARQVAVLINDKKYKMSGSGTAWSLSEKIEDPGAINFSIMAANEDGIDGLSQGGTVLIKAGSINVVEVKPSPETGYAGEEFTITAQTNLPAKSVSLQMDGKTYAMEGSDKLWHYKKEIPDIGKKQFTIIAKNIEGATGLSKSGEILTQKSPLPIPDIAMVDVSVVSPGQGYAGDKFTINVKTTTPSDKVFIEIEGEQHLMKGTGTQWSYVTKVDKVGDSKYLALARNADGVQGRSKEGIITTTKEPAKSVNVLTAEVNPQKGQAGKKFAFKAMTDRPAKNVTLLLGKKYYEMRGSGTSWHLDKTIDQTGEIDFSIFAKNEDGVKGAVKTAAVSVVAERFKDNADGTITDLLTGKATKRFVDNGDGTVTDILTSLMWLKQPKQIAVTWEDAAEYCRNLKLEGHTGWRLPTIDEFKKLGDTKQQNPALPPGNPFSNVLTHVTYWSKSKHKFGPQYVYNMSMWYGKVGYLKKTENGIVWAVRYAEMPG